VAKVGTSNPDRTISLKRLQCVVEKKIPMVDMITYGVTIVTSGPMGKMVTLVTKCTNILMVKGKR